MFDDEILYDTTIVGHRTEQGWGKDGHQTRLPSGVKGHNCHFQQKGVGKCRRNSTGPMAMA